MQAGIRPDEPAVHAPGISVTFSELNRLVMQAATFFYQRNILPGNVVVLDIDDEFLLLVCMFGLARMGATVVTLTDSVQLEEAAEGIEIDAYVFEDGAEKEGVPVTREALMKMPFDASVYTAVPEAAWQIMAGSGTTGRRKWIAVTHDRQLAMMRSELRWLNADADDRVATLVHMGYNVTKHFYLEALHAGLCIVLTDKRHPDILEALSANKITVLHATVYHAQMLLQLTKMRQAEPLDSLNALLLGGSTVSYALREQIVERLCERLYVRYGAIEIGTIAVAGPEEVLLDGACVGQAIDGVEVEVIDDNGRCVNIGEVGEIRIRSSGMFDGYFGNASATRQKLLGGWFYPGDMGRFGPERTLMHLGRADDMIMLNGINVYPSEIETVLRSHPDVYDAVVSARTSRHFGQIPVAVVALESDGTATEQALLRYGRQRLGLRAARRIFIVDTLPRNTQGKVPKAIIDQLTGDDE